MKFLDKINRIYLFILLSTLVFVSFFGYFILNNLILEDTKEKLIEKEFLIKQQIKIDSIIPNFHPFVEITRKVDKNIDNPKFKTVLIKNQLEENELEPYIEYLNEIEVDNAYYIIKLRQSIVEKEDLIFSIGLTVLIILILTFGLIFSVNKILTQRIWNKFKSNLNIISNFSFNQPIEIELLNSNIVEFDKLNDILKRLTKKLRVDFISAKEFAENASHEMQTPLSITIMNLENVLQEDLPKNVSNKIYASYQSVIKLQKLSKNLLLLSKIENQQFNNIEKIDLAILIKEKIEIFSPLSELKKLDVKLNQNQFFFINIDPFLADILISNLLTNAINHNIENGFITVFIDKNKVSISNSSKGYVLKEEAFFERFKKGNPKSETTGLGLSIVKKIIDSTDINIYIKQDKSITIVTLTK